MKHSFKSFLIIGPTLVALMFSALGVTPAYAVDITPPTVVNVFSTTPDGMFKMGDVIDARVKFSEIVYVTGTPQLTFETGAIDRAVNYVSGSGTDTILFYYVVQAGDTSTDLDYVGTDPLKLNGGSIKDLALNPANLTTMPVPGAQYSFGYNNNFVIDGIAPTISIGAPTPTTTSSGPVTYTVTYADANFNSSTLAPDNITLNKTGAANGTIGVSGAGLTRTVTISAITGNGTLGISIAAGTATDLAGNLAPAAGPSTTFTVDNVVPTVTNVTSTAANGMYKLGDTIAVTVTFSEIVNVTGTPQLMLETGATDRAANYVSGTGTTTLTFNYIVQAGDISSDLDYVATTSLSLNGGSIKDAATNAAVLTLASPGAPNSLGYNKAIVIDGIAPVVTAFTAPSPATTLTIQISAFAATDAAGVTGYLITTSATPPLPGTGGWSGTAPTTYTVGSNGIYTLYPWAKDAAGNVSAVFGAPPVVVVNVGAADITPPTVNTFTVPSPSASLNIPITAFTASDGTGVTGYLITTSATLPLPGADGWSGAAPTTYTVSSNGTYILYPWAKDAAGNVSAVFGTPRTVIVSANTTDTTAPTVNTFTAPTSSASFNIPILAFTASDDTDVTGYLITASATPPLPGAGGWSGTTPTTYMVSSNGTYTLYPWAKDAAGNVSAVFGTPRTVIVADTTAPTISIGAPTPTVTKSGPVMYTVTYADTNFNSSTLAPGNITLNKTGTANGTVGVSGTGLTRTVTISSITGDGTLGIFIAAGTATDLAGNTAPAAGPSQTFTVDNTAPVVTNVTSTTVDGAYKADDTIVVTVTFNEIVNVTGAPLLMLETGATDRAANYVSGTGTTTLIFNYVVQAGDTSGDLDYVVTNPLRLNGGTIKDVLTNPAILTLASPGTPNSLGYNKGIVIDTTAPTVTNVTSTTADGAYKAGDTIAVTVTFNEIVNVTGTPQLTLETGATDRTANYASGTGTTTLTFNYVVQAGDTSGDLDYVATTSLGLNGGTIKDVATNAAVLTLASPGTANSLGYNKAIVIDTTAPTVTNVTSDTPNGIYKIGDTITITVTFSESVSVAGTPQLTLETGATDRAANFASGTGTTVLTFNYVVQAGDTSGDLDYVATTSLGLNGGTIKDVATNAAVLTLASPGTTNSLGYNKAIVIDGVAPTISIGAPTPTITQGGPVTYTVTYADANFNSSTLAIGDITLNKTGTADGTVSVSGIGLTRTVTISTTTGDGTLGISIAAGTATDFAGNTAPAAGPSATFAVDNTAPTVVSILRANPDPNAATKVNFTVTFSESVAGVGTDDFSLTTTGVSGATISGFSGSGSVYTVTVNTGTGNNGTIRLDLPVSAAITDLAGNPISGMPFDTGETYTINRNVAVYVGGELEQSYFLAASESARDSYAGVNSGPVKVMSTNATPMSILAAQRILYYGTGTVPTSFVEMMGLPDSQLDTTYWFPWYKNDGIVDTQLRIGNVSGSAATVHIYVAGVEVPGSPFVLTTSGAGQSQRLSFALNDGPVKVVSDQNIVATERLIYFDSGVPISFSEMMGLPNSQLSMTYWFPWYKNVDEIDTQLRFGNVSGSTATVHVYIAGVEVAGSPFTLTATGAGQSLRVSFPVNDGPVKIVSDQNIVAAQRILYYANGLPTSFVETMGLPDGQLSTTHWFPWYKNDGIVDTQLRLGNVSGVPASVHVYIGIAEMVGSPFALTAAGAGQSLRLSFTANDGPVKIVSDQNIVSSERLIYFADGVPVSFSEMLGLPDSLLSPTWWLPWYKNVGEIDTQLRFGVP